MSSKKTVKRVTYTQTKKAGGRSLIVRILAFALAAIMVIGVGYYIVLLIGGQI